MMIRKWVFAVLVAVFLIAQVAMFQLGATAQGGQGDVWQFVSDRPVLLAPARDIDHPARRWLDAGSVITIRGPYVQADDLVWAEAVGRAGYVAVARYGTCEIRSYGTYNPAGRAPVSIP